MGTGLICLIHSNRHILVIVPYLIYYLCIHAYCRLCTHYVGATTEVTLLIVAKISAYIHVQLAAMHIMHCIIGKKERKKFELPLVNGW